MRDLAPAWPRWVGLLTLVAVLGWGLTLIEPDPSRLAASAYERLAVELVSGPLAARGGDLERAGQLRVVGGAACDAAVAKALSDQLPAGAPGTLEFRCDMDGARATLTARLIAPGEAPDELGVATGTVPGALSLMPPLLAILLAFLVRRVAISLFAGIAAGALLVEQLQPWPAVERTVVDYLIGTTIDTFNVYVYTFTLALIGMVNVCIAMGGMAGLRERVSRLARDVRSTQAAVALMGVAVFFDDYANTVVIGGAARPLTDARRISREKLAYIVDSTAAPIAGIAIISTWIGIEVQYFQETLDQLGAFTGAVDSGYEFFFQVLPFRFYCFFALGLVFIVALTGRDFGPMLSAERRARGGARVAPRPRSGKRLPVVTGAKCKDGVKPRWINGVLPIVVVIAATLIGSVQVGAENLAAKGEIVSWWSLSDLARAFISVEDASVRVLLIAALLGSAVAILLALGQRLLSLGEAVKAWFTGVMAMLPAIGILILAMAIRQVTDDLLAAEYLAAVLVDVPAQVFPLVTFLLAGAVAFATGTSWGTMAILVPVAVPVAASVAAGLPSGELILFLVGAAVLDGAIFGDHCSLISDTTVMSSIACGCDHLEHVRTQMPYSLLAMGVAATTGYTLVAWTGTAGWWLSYPLGFILLYLIVRWRGRVAAEL